MPRYRTTPQARQRAFDDEGYDLIAPPHLIVYEPYEPWQKTGVLDAEGVEVERYYGFQPVGFLAEHEE